MTDVAIETPRGTSLLDRRRRHRGAGGRCGAAAQARWPSSSGSTEVRDQLSLVLGRGPDAGRGARPRAAVRSARAGQDDAGDDHRRTRCGRRCASPAGRPSSTPATWRRSCPRWPRARCCSSTRSTACPGRPRRCSTWRWRTSGSTSSSARVRAPPRSRWNFRRSRSSAPPPVPGCCPAPLRDRFGFTGAHGVLRRRRAGAGVRPLGPAARRARSSPRRRRDGRPFPRDAAHRQPPAAPGPRLRPGQGRRRR